MIPDGVVVIVALVWGMRSMRVVPIAAAALLVVGCSGTADEPQPTTSEAPVTATSEPEEPGEPEEPEASPTEWDVAPSEEAPNVPGDEGPPEAEEGDAEEAGTAAHAAVEAYFSTADPEEWWTEFSKHLTPAAQEVWQYTDPRRVPAGAPEGSAEYGLVSATDAEITVPTTIGDFQLMMVRADPADEWKVSYLEPPEEVG